MPNVSFSSPINCAAPKGGVTTATTQCGTLSSSANVTASISADTSGGALTLLSVASFMLETVTEIPDPGELPPGTKPVPVKIELPVQQAQTNGMKSLNATSGQFVVVAIQFAPTGTTPDSSTATLLINGDTWNPISIPITATVGEGSAGDISVKVPPISIDQGTQTIVPVTLTLVSGAPTKVKLSIAPDSSPGAPNVDVTIGDQKGHQDLVSLTSGTSVSPPLTASADSTLAAGDYSWSLYGWYDDNTMSFFVPFNIVVETAYFNIQSNVPPGNLIGIKNASTAAGALLDAPAGGLGNDNQCLWKFSPGGGGYYYIQSKLVKGNVIDIQKASTAAGAPLDAYPQKTDADNQLWYFVSDPWGAGSRFIVSKLNGNVIDVSPAAGAPLVANPPKFPSPKSQRWEVTEGDFPSVVKTVHVPSGTLVQGNANYFLESSSEAIYGLSVTVNFHSEFISSTGGYSFQLNCYSTEGPSVTTKNQQNVIYAAPGSNQLMAQINNWAGGTELNDIVVPLASLPSPTIRAGYKLNIKLTYWGDSALVSGATYTVTDNMGNPLGTATITIVGNTLLTTNEPATVANLAPIAALQFNIGGADNGLYATLTGGAGTITYDASVPLAALGTAPSYVEDFVTEENANVVFGPLPWPWSVSMDNDEPSLSIVQTFQAST